MIDQKRIIYDLLTQYGFVKFMARAAILAARFSGKQDAEPIGKESCLCDVLEERLTPTPYSDGWESLFHRLGQLPNDNDKLDGQMYRDDLRRLLQPVHASTLTQIKKLKPTPGQGVL